jgi:putative DNA primase/helicase
MTDETGSIPEDEPKTPPPNVLRGRFGGPLPKPSDQAGDPDPTNAGADASASGEAKPPAKKTTGALKPAGGNKRREKPIDYGKFNSLLNRFWLIYGTDAVFDGEDRVIMKISAMAHAHGADMVRMWKADPKRRVVKLKDVVFDPTMTCGPQCVNLFGGMEMVPMKGNVKPALDLIDYLVSRVSDDEVERDEIKHFLMCWMAWPLQHVGAKLRTAIIMHGDEGAGKNFLFDMLTEIYGEYGALVGQDELEDKFNEWRSGKMFIVGDEVSSRAELVHNKNRLKSLIGSTSVQINPKGTPRRKEKNHINIVFLSNEIQPLALDNSDRRYCVIYTPPRLEFEYYKRLAEWADAGGVAFFHDYLLRYECTEFNPNAPAPWTKAKEELIEINRKSPERFWTDWHDGILDLPYRSCSIEQAYQGYQKYCQRIGDRFPVQSNLFSRLVSRFSENQGAPVRTKVMNINDPKAGRKAYRMLLVCEPEFNGEKEGAWAAKTVEAFSKHLTKYQGGGWNGPRTPSEQEQGDRGNDTP